MARAAYDAFVKRGVLTVGMFVLFGVVVNIAVAWACALWQPLEVDFPVYERGWASGQRAEALLRVAIPKHAQVPVGGPSIISVSPCALC